MVLMRMQLNEAVSKRLTELLSERHMTQYQLFMKSGVPKSTIGNVINCSYESVKLPGYTEAYKPEFSSTATDFRVILKNVNYIMCGASAHDTAHDAAHDTSVISKQNLLLEFCADPKSRDEMQAYIDVSSRSHFSKYYLKPLLSSGKLEMMFPDKPKSKNQKYTTVHSK